MHHAEALKHLRQFERADSVIDGAAAALKLDAHGDWIISGGRGSIVCNCGLFTIHVGCRSRRHWGLRTVASGFGGPLGYGSVPLIGDTGQIKVLNGGIGFRSRTVVGCVAPVDTSLPRKAL